MSERTRTILHRLLAAGVIIGSAVAIWSFVSGCAYTEIEFPFPTPEGIATARYTSNRDTALEDLHLEVSRDGTLYVTLGSATGRASDVVAAQAQVMSKLIDRIPSP